MKKNNIYSFYTFNESDIFLPLDNDENSVISDLFNDDEQVNVYGHHEILQEYYFASGNTSLYRKFDNNKLALLYENEQDKNGNTNISIYNCDTFYNGILKSNKFNTIVSMNAKDFLFIDKYCRYCSKCSICKKH